MDGWNKLQAGLTGMIRHVLLTHFLNACKPIGLKLGDSAKGSCITAQASDIHR